MPGSLGEALQALDRADWLREGLGTSLLQAFMLMKRHEWDRFARHVTDWEIAEYLPHH